MQTAASQLVLSLFPGIGLLDRAFEDSGFTILRGPDKLFGGDIHRFHFLPGVVTGIIGGPPCQKFCTANWEKRDIEAGMILVNEFLRVVTEGQPAWALMENVNGSPAVTLAGYRAQLIYLNAADVGSQQNRPRKFHFFHRPGTRELVLKREAIEPSQSTCLASEAGRKGRRSWATFCQLQGLPAGYDLPGFTIAGKYQAVGNGVPYPLALALSQAILSRDRAVTPHRLCECGCGQYVHGKARLAGADCRKRMQRVRDAESLRPLELGQLPLV